MPQTRAKVAQAPKVVKSSSQSDKEGNGDGSGSRLSHSGSNSLEAYKTQHDKADSQSLANPSITSIDPRNIRWRVLGMETIYNKELELKGQGKPVRQLHKKSRLNDSWLSRVPDLEAEINQHGLRCLLERLGKYALYLVREFYTAYDATIYRDLPNRKKVID